MRQTILLSILLFTASVGYCNSPKNSKIQNRIFDASSIKKDGVEILTGYSATPKEGILDSFSVTLPEYESVVYISGQNREKILDGMNRVYSWAAKDLKTITSKDFKPDPVVGETSRNGLLALFKLKNDEFLLLQGIASPTAMSYFSISNEGKLHIKLATFGVDAVSGDIPLVPMHAEPMYTMFFSRHGKMQ